MDPDNEKLVTGSAIVHIEPKQAALTGCRFTTRTRSTGC